MRFAINLTTPTSVVEQRLTYDLVDEQFPVDCSPLDSTDVFVGPVSTSINQLLVPVVSKEGLTCDIEHVNDTPIDARRDGMKIGRNKSFPSPSFRTPRDESNVTAVLKKSSVGVGCDNNHCVSSKHHAGGGSCVREREASSPPSHHSSCVGEREVSSHHSSCVGERGGSPETDHKPVKRHKFSSYDTSPPPLYVNDVASRIGGETENSRCMHGSKDVHGSPTTRNGSLLLTMSPLTMVGTGSDSPVLTEPPTPRSHHARVSRAHSLKSASSPRVLMNKIGRGSCGTPVSVGGGSSLRGCSTSSRRISE